MRIAIVKLSALGDIVYAMIVLQFIKQFNKDILIDWIVEESYKELLEFNPHINKIHTLNIKNARKKNSIKLFFRELRKARSFDKYDVVIDMQGLLKSAIISFLIPSKLTCGFNHASIKESVASFFYNKTFKIGYEENIIKRNLKLAGFALDFPTNMDGLLILKPYLFSRKKYHFSFTSKTKKNVILIPGASHSSKMYPVKKFAELANLINANIIIIWGNLEEKNLANQIKGLSPGVCVSSKLSLELLVNLVSQVDLVIGSDTGPTHIAWALNVPSICLFGSTPGNRNTLATNFNKVLESKSKVNPYKIDKKDNSINTLRVKDIYNIANKLLS